MEKSNIFRESGTENYKRIVLISSSCAGLLTPAGAPTQAAGIPVSALASAVGTPASPSAASAAAGPAGSCLSCADLRDRLGKRSD